VTEASASSVAAVILVYNDSRHVRRWLKAIEPLRIFAHCDAHAPNSGYEARRQGASGNVEFCRGAKLGGRSLPASKSDWLGSARDDKTGPRDRRKIK
jgi:hypothetical protein